MPTISVIIPAYNAAPYIGETLDSVFGQTSTDYEVIVINDGSPDTAELERVLETYLHRITYLKQENLGASAARNAGLRKARGEFVAFLDADDVWLPSYLRDQLAFIEQQGCDMVCADAMHFGGSPFDGRTYMDVLMADAPSNGEVTFKGLISGKQSLITSGVVARREAIFKVGLFDEALRNSQDFDLWLRLARNGSRLAYQRKLLLHYRYHAKSLSGDAVNRVMRELRVYEKVLDSYDLLPDERFTFVKGDLRDAEALAETLGRHRPDAVAHLAAMAAVRYSVQHPLIYGHVNVQALHGLSFQAGTLLRLRAGFEGVAGAHDVPPQQFSVRKPTSAFIVSNRAA